MNLVNHLTTRVPETLDTSDRVRLAISTFVATAASVMLVHQFLPGAHELPQVIVHSLALALTYTACVLAVSWVLFVLVRHVGVSKVEVWHLWTMSFTAFNLGYFLDAPMGNIHPDVESENPWLRYARLVPIWSLITYVFIQAYTRRALSDELEQLVRIKKEPAHAAPAFTGQTISVVSGKERSRFDADRVSHVSVEDHYCYVHHRDETGWRRTDVTLSLKEFLACAPASFLLVHRSHVVNPSHLERIERHGRSYRLILTNGMSVPISRHRLNQVLPTLRQYLG